MRTTLTTSLYAVLALLIPVVSFGASLIYKGGVSGGGSSYTWSLGDLADQAARITDAVQWDNGSWADPYDTEAELTALGWQTVDIQCVDLYDNAATPQTTGAPDGNCDLDRTVARIDCADAGSGSGSDETAINALIAAACPNGTPKDCANDPSGGFDTAGDRAGVIFKFPSGACHIDLLSGTSGPNTVGGMTIPYSNIAFVGDGMDNSFINCNDVGNESSSYSTCVGTTFPFGTQWAADPGGPCAPTWESDMPYGGTCEDTSNVETLTAAVSVGQTSITSTTACTTIDANDRVLLKGTSADGEPLWLLNEAATDCDGSNVITLRDPIRYAIPGTVTAVEARLPQTRKTFFIGLSIGYPHAPDGASRDAVSAHHLYFNHPTEVLVSESRLGPYTNFAYGDIGSYRVSIRHSEIGPGQKSKRRGTNGRVFHLGESTIAGSYSIFDNVFVGAAKRFVEGSQMSTNATWYGFNYMSDMTTDVVGESGSHFNGVATPQGIAHSTACGVGSPDACDPAWERTVYFGHDSNSTGKPGMTLIEANDLGGHMFAQTNAGDANRYTTVYRNRQNRETLCGGSRDGTVACGSPYAYDSGTYDMPYWNWIANRFVEWTDDNTHQTNVLGRWNVAEEASGAGDLTATGYSWPTSSTYKNYVDTGPHDDYGTVDIPPSLALQTDTAPDWWCTESGPWDGTWSFAYGDGGDNGGTPRKLPAQIRYESGTCTPP